MGFGKESLSPYPKAVLNVLDERHVSPCFSQVNRGSTMVRVTMLDDYDPRIEEGLQESGVVEEDGDWRGVVNYILGGISLNERR